MDLHMMGRNHLKLGSKKEVYLNTNKTLFFGFILKVSKRCLLLFIYFIFPHVTKHKLHSTCNLQVKVLFYFILFYFIFIYFYLFINLFI